MTAYFSYVGDIDDPDFYWDDPAACPKAGNLPRRLIPAEKSGSLGIDIFYVMQSIKEGLYDGKKLDWGAWGLKMTWIQMQEFLSSKQRHVTAVTALDPDKFYVLIAAEVA